MARTGEVSPKAGPLIAEAGCLASLPLDLSRPAWQMWFVEAGPRWEPNPPPSGLEYFVDGLAELGTAHSEQRRPWGARCSTPVEP